MAVGTICYVRFLLSAICYPADMPLPVVRSPLGLPLGDRGLLPLPDAPPGVGAGVVAGGPYTLPQRMWDTLTRASSRTGAQGGNQTLVFVNPGIQFPNSIHTLTSQYTFRLVQSL